MLRLVIGCIPEVIPEHTLEIEDIQVIEKAGMQFYKGRLGAEEAVVVRSGVGKVNAAVCTQILADVFNVDAVINTGIAGSLDADIDIGDIVISTDVLHHDMDATGFGYPIGQVPQMDTFAFSATAAMSSVFFILVSSKNFFVVEPLVDLFNFLDRKSVV